MHKSMIHIVLLVALCLFLPMQALAIDDGVISSAQDTGEIRFVGTAGAPLRVRKEPYNNAKGVAKYDKNETVYMRTVDAVWCMVQTSRTTGYVLREYVRDICYYDADTQTKGEQLQLSSDIIDGNATETATSYENSDVQMIAFTGKVALIREAKEQKSRIVGDIPLYKEVEVLEVDGDWSLIRYKNLEGYVLNSQLFKWDRVNPYSGDIPGLDIITMLAYTNQSTKIYSLETNKELKVVNPGSALSVIHIDEQGRYILPYWRELAYVKGDNIAYSLPVVPYEQSKAGDMISAMSTYYAVGISTLEYQGRNWNINLATSFISGTVLEPGEEFIMNDCIGPYRITSGFKRAPIMSPHALSGFGGGTCQVNTTFYIANLQIPVLVTHRKVHADVGIYYAKKGFDAAVGGGDINLHMTNTLPFAIRYQCFMSDGVLTVAIFRER